MREEVFAPLGMNDSGYDHSAPNIRNRAAGYHLEGTKLENADYINMAGPYSAGALYSTVEDLYKWDQALYGSTVLSTPALQLMWTPVLNGYGYGWFISDPSQTSGPAPFWAVPDKYEVAHDGKIMDSFGFWVALALALVVVILIAKTATVVPQQSAFVVEYLGKYSRTLSAGFHILVPFVESIAYRHSLKETAIDIPEQVCITRDNVQV